MKRLLLLILVMEVVAHIVLWLDLPLILQAIAVLVLAALLPGLALVELLVGQGDTRPEPLEHFAYAVASGYAISVLVMLLISYMPGAIPRWLPLLVIDVVLICLLGMAWRRARGREQPSLITGCPLGHSSLITGLLIVLAVGGFLRFANLGYAEFLTDEARVVLRADAVIQGQEDVLFIHRKAPTEILLPAAIFAVTGHIDEATARLPFALANLVGLLSVFLLGWRLLGALAGWVAAFLLAFDGYLIGFARFVQYQSVVFLVSALVILILYRLVQTGKLQRSYVTLAGILLALGLLSHYDAILVIVPVLFLFGVVLLQQRQNWSALLRAVLPGLLTGLVMLALFYIPFVLHPHFRATYTYLVDQRLVADRVFPYNNLVDVMQRSVVYNSTYYVLLLIALITVALVMAYRRGWNRTWGTMLGAVFILFVLVIGWRADWLKLGDRDWLVVPFVLLLVLIWIAPRLKVEERLLWLWFGVPLLLALFFTAYPRTHVYVFFTPGALLGGAVVAQAWGWMQQRLGQSPATMVGAAAVCVATVIFGGYAYWYFVYNQAEVLRTWETNHPAAYWTPFGRPTTDGLYGFPLANGWKVVGSLYAQGVLQGDYETNQRDDLISGWYTRQQHRCASTAAWYFAIDNLEFWSSHSQPSEDSLREQGYTPWGVVEVNGAPRMTIYRRGSDVSTVPQTFQLTDYAPVFDALARPGLPLRDPVVEPRIEHPLHINFGNQIWLEGYQIEYNEPLTAGDTFRLTLDRRAQQAGLAPYKVFNQSYYGNASMVAQKDGYSVCDRRPTSLWLPGELVVDVYDIPVAADAPAGVYPLYTGLYREENFERLPVLDATGNPVDNQVHVTDLSIQGGE